MAAIAYKAADGKRIPSVTTVCKQAGWGGNGLLYWANQQGLEGRTLEDAREESTGPGTIVHAMADAHSKGESVDLSRVPDEWQEKCELSFATYRSWFDGNVSEVVGSELKVISERLRYGGTMDRLYVDKQGRLCLLDLKVANGVYDSNLLQVAGYGIAWEENNPSKCIDLYQLLRVHKESGAWSFHGIPTTSMAPAFDGFRVCRRLYDLQKSMKGLV